MPSTAEQAIYDRLASAPSFHPASAELLLNDWTLEPGDVVTVKSGESNYNLPIYSLNLNWTGSNIGGAENSNTTRITIESTGNKEREPLPELRRKQFEQDRFAYGGFRAQQQEIDEHYQHVVEVTDQGMSDAFGILGVSIGADGMPAKDSSGNYIWDDSGTGGEIWGHLNRNAWTSVIQNHIQDANGNILSIAKVLTNADGQALIQAINDQRTGTATINANRIKLNATDTITLDAKLSINANTGRLSVNGALDVSSNVYVHGDAYIDGAIEMYDTFYGDSESFQAVTARFGASGSGVSQRILGHGSLLVGLDATENADGTITISFADNSSGGHDSANFRIAATQYFLDTLAKVSFPTPPRTSANFEVAAPGPVDENNAVTTIRKYFYLGFPSADSWTTASEDVTVEMKHNENGSAVSDGIVARKSLDISSTKYYIDGVADAYANGQTDGYNDGYADGLADGYNSGYEDGKNYVLNHIKLYVSRDNYATQTELINGQSVTLNQSEQCEIDLEYNGNYIRFGYVNDHDF